MKGENENDGAASDDGHSGGSDDPSSGYSGASESPFDEHSIAQDDQASSRSEDRNLNIGPDPEKSDDDETFWAPSISRPISETQHYIARSNCRQQLP